MAKQQQQESIAVEAAYLNARAGHMSERNYWQHALNGDGSAQIGAIVSHRSLS